MEAGESAETSARAIPVDVYCPKCAYFLFGAQGDLCSECKYCLDGLRSAPSKIPWVHRQQGSWLTHYWQTVWMVTFKNQTFCEEYARPISYADARRFQWVTILHVYVVLLIFLPIIYYRYSPSINTSPTSISMFFPTFTPVPTPWVQAYRQGWPLAIVMACALPLLLATTGIPSYCFHPSAINVRRQNAAVALSYYLCAPLAFAPVIMIGLLPPIWASDFTDKYGWLSLLAIALAVASRDCHVVRNRNVFVVADPYTVGATRDATIDQARRSDRNWSAAALAYLRAGVPNPTAGVGAIRDRHLLQSVLTQASAAPFSIFRCRPTRRQCRLSWARHRSVRLELPVRHRQRRLHRRYKAL